MERVQVFAQQPGQLGTDDVARLFGRDGQRLDRRPAAHFGAGDLGQIVQAPIDKLAMGGEIGDAALVLASLRGKFIEPGATHRRPFAWLAPVALVFRPSRPISQEQALHQRGWQRGRREQNAAAQQARPVHQPSERRQVFDAEVVRLVQNQVGGHQTQHGRDLVAAARAFGRGHQVVDGAGEYGGIEQAQGVAVFAQPAFNGPFSRLPS